MPFALDAVPSTEDLSSAVNYLLANFSTGLSSNAGTGQITGPTGSIVGYLYKYMAIKYADNSSGTLNFSNSPTGRGYYGLRNSNSSTESNNPADYVWNQATGGFGSTKFLYYISTGGRQINFRVATSLPDTGWVIDSGASIDLDVVTSGNIPVIAESFVSYFTPSILQVPRSGSPLSPSFTGITPIMYATDKGNVIPFTDAQTDSNVGFVNNSWRIGNSSTTGYADISKTNITIDDPTDAGDYASWPNPTAMSNSPAYLTVPVRYKNSTGVVSQASVSNLQLIFTDPGANGLDGPTVDISGFTGFTQNAGGAYTPTNATLSAVTTNVTSPTYAWSISGATPISSTASSVVVTPTSSATSVVVTLTVNGSNLLSPSSKTISMPIVYNGAPGTAGSNGVMSAFPTIYQWTGSSTPPSRPTTTSTYTWATGAFTAPSGWSTSAPSNTTAGNYLWSITYPVTTTATTTTSTLDWTDTANPIRAIAYNGANGGNGSNGSNGSATFVITRVANDSSAPTNAEVAALLGRTPVSGDIVTVSYNNYNNATIYRYVTSWVLFNTYITGSLIVQNTITGDKISANTITATNIAASTITGTQIAANTVTATNINSNNLTIRNGSGTVLFGSGTNLDYSNIIPSTGWLNSNVTLNETTGVISLGGAGSGSVTAVTTNNKISSANISTYMASAAIGTAYIGDAAITTAKIGNAQITGNLLVDGGITASKIAASTITGDKISANTVTASNINSNNLTIRDGSGTILFGAGTNLNYSNITASSGWLNSNVSISSSGVLSGAGGGTVTVSGLDNSIVRSANPINSSNISTYIAGAAIGTAYIANAAITSALIGDAQITNAKIGTAAVDTLQIAGQAVTLPTGITSYDATVIYSASGFTPVSTTVLTQTVTSTGAPTLVTVSTSYSPPYQIINNNGDFGASAVVVSLKRNGTTLFETPKTGAGVGYDTNGNIGSDLCTFSVMDTPSAGSNSYTLVFTASYPSAYNGYNKISTIATLEAKR